MSESLVSELYGLRRRFGEAAAERKLALLTQIAALTRLSARDLLLLADTLNFLRAYPDNSALLAAVRAEVARLRERIQAVSGGSESQVLRDRGFPGSFNSYAYSYAVAQRMITAGYPMDLDWDDIDDLVLSETIELLLTDVETELLDQLPYSWQEWFAEFRPPSARSDLDHLLQLFVRSHFSPQEQMYLFEACGLPIRYEISEPGLASCEVEWRVDRTVYQKKDLPRETFPLPPRIRRPLADVKRVSLAVGRELVDLSLRALCSRNLEIFPLIYASERDVVVHDGPRGIQVMLAGVHSEYRSPLASLYFFLVLKNGAPIAYGPASPFLGACELGINLFPEYRGGEIRTIYAEVLRVLHHVLGADLFYMTSYGLGVGNETAIQTAAFWFYRKLGFVPTNPRVDELAREEEARMRADPKHRSSRRMLRRLSDTEVYLDLSVGATRRFPFDRFAVELSRFVATEWDGDRERATVASEERIKKALGIRDLAHWPPLKRRAFRQLAPVLTFLDESLRRRGADPIADWPVADRRSLVRYFDEKVAVGEARAAQRLAGHRKLRDAFFESVT